MKTLSQRPRFHATVNRTTVSNRRLVQRAEIALPPEQGSGTILDQQAISDIIAGGAFLGAGGGGPTSLGKEILATLQNPQIQQVALDAVDEEKWVVIAAFMGSPDAALKLKVASYTSLTRAVRALQTKAGLVASYVVPVEIGAINSIAPMLVANDLQIPIVDADGAGRAVPTLSCLTFGTVDELLEQGCSVANETDDDNDHQSATFSVNNAGEAESVAGAVLGSQAYANLGGLAIWMMTGAQLKNNAIRGGLSNARQLGAALRAAQTQVENGEQVDFPALVIKTLKSLNIKAELLMNQANAVSFTNSTENSLDHGQIVLTGSDSAKVTVYTVNENLVAYSSDAPAPIITAPDMLCWLLPDGTTLDNSELQQLVEQQRQDSPPLTLHVFGVEANPKLRDNSSVITAFQTLFQELGYAGSYVPFEAEAP